MEVGRLLLRARAAGLRLIPPDRWESAILAADLVIGDHGSVTLYAAASGVPVLLGAYDSSQIVPDSPMAALANLVPRLNAGAALEPQIRSGLAQSVTDAAYSGACAATGALGRSLEITQREAYRLLDLPRPAEKPRVRAPEPPNPAEPGTPRRPAYQVIVSRSASAEADLTVRRFAAVVDPTLSAGDREEEICRHLAVDAAEADVALPSVLIALLHAAGGQTDAVAHQLRNGVSVRVGRSVTRVQLYDSAAASPPSPCPCSSRSACDSL